MIKSLLIGSSNNIDIYNEVMSKHRFFDKPDKLIVSQNNTNDLALSFQQYDALMFVSPTEGLFESLAQAIKIKSNIYYTDQPTLSEDELTRLLTLHSEANNLIFPEINELNHPLLQEFLSTNSNHLLFRYNKTIKTKNQVRGALLNALSFLTILSPMQVKKIDINSIETTNLGRPAFKIRLKLFDSSVAYIFLRLGKNNEHSIIIESRIGNFIFNLNENYLENAHGARFQGEPILDNDLLQKSIEQFAMCIILNKKPNFNFYHFTLTAHLLNKIEKIILHNF